MSDLIRNSLADSTIRDTALEILRGFASVGYEHFCQDARLWVSQHTVLIGERDEMLIPPEQAINTIVAQGAFYGDCDDSAMLLAALCASVGIPIRLRAIGKNPDLSFSHVFVEAAPDCDRWLALDATIPGYPAWQGDSFLMEV